MGEGADRRRGVEGFTYRWLAMFIHAEKQLTADQQAARDRAHELRRSASIQIKNTFQRQVEQYSAPRRLIYNAVESQTYAAVMLGVILLYSILMAFYEPLKTDDDGANWLIKQSEGVFTIVFLFDVLMQLTHSGPKRYFFGKEKWWNALDVFVVAAGLVSFLPGADSSFGILRMLRVLRPLRTLNKVQSVKHVVVALGRVDSGAGERLRAGVVCHLHLRPFRCEAVGWDTRGSLRAAVRRRRRELWPSL